MTKLISRDVFKHHRNEGILWARFAWAGVDPIPVYINNLALLSRCRER